MKDDSSQPSLDNANDPLAKLFKEYKQNNRFIVSIAVAGVFLFILIAIAFPLRNKILERFYPKLKSQATACSVVSQIPTNKAGFVFTGGDLEQAISSLSTPLYTTNDYNLGPKKSFYIIGKYAQNQADPLNLRLLMENNLANTDFKGLRDQKPAGWEIATSEDGAGLVDIQSHSKLVSSTSIKLFGNKSATGTKLTQVFKKPVSGGQFVVFGAWVKAVNPSDIKVAIQNSQAPFEEFGVADTSSIEPDAWTYVTGYGKVPAGVTNFQVSLSTVQSKQAWFSSVSAAPIGADQNQAITNLILERCGSAWMVDDAPGWEQSSSSPFIKPLSPEIYALIYHQFYTLIKNTDPAAKVFPGALMGAPVTFENQTGYGPKTFLDSFRKSYKDFFGSEPPIDALGVRYLATDQNRWTGSADFENYVAKVKSYTDTVSEWKGKPIWVTRLGVSNDAPQGGLDFMQAAVKFLINNNLNIEKWFWYDTCGINNQLAPLFASSNKICSWPMKLTKLGETYVDLNIVATPTPLSSAIISATPSATVTPTPTPASSPRISIPELIQNILGPKSTESANVKEGTESANKNE